MGTKENVSLELFTGDEEHLAQAMNLLTAATQKFYLFTYYVSPSLYYYLGGYFLVKEILGMCRWIGSHFHNLTDYNGVTFLVELLEWGRKFSGFLG